MYLRMMFSMAAGIPKGGKERELVSGEL